MVTRLVNFYQATLRSHQAVVTCCEEARLPVDPTAENGEYHSFVFAGPLFAQPVGWSAGRLVVDGRSHELEIDIRRPGAPAQ